MRIIYLLFLTLIILACSSAPPVPTDHFYRLTLPTQGLTKTNLTEDMIYVGPILAEGLYNERALLFTGSSMGELKQRHYHFWLTSPPRLLRDHLVHFLREVELSPIILAETGSGDVVRIFGKLYAFEQTAFDNKSQVNIAIEFRVNKTGDELPLLLRDYRVEENINGGGQTDVIAAYDRAVIRLFSEFVNDLNSNLP